MERGEIVARLTAFLPAELRRARRQLRGARRETSGKPVHEARKSIKKLRAAMRLAREMAPARTIDPVANALRDAAHALGPLRDHLVLGETGRSLAKRGEKIPAEPEPPSAPPALKRASTRLRQAVASLSRLIQAGLKENGAEPGLRRLYKHAADEMEKARKGGFDEDLHAWRRRTKDLLYVLELIDAPERIVKKLGKLGTLLGDDHDFATFIVHHDSIADKNAQDHLLARAKEKRGPLQKKAFRIGKKLFDASPRKFVRRLAA